MKREKPKRKDNNDYVDAAKVLTTKERKMFHDLATDERAAKATIDAAKEDSDACKTDLRGILEKCGHEKVQDDFHKVCTYGGTRKSVDVGKLLERGVPAKIIEACTVETRFSVVRVTARPSPEQAIHGGK